MQLNLLTRKEKLKFLDLAMHMATVDKTLSERENQLLVMFTAEVGEGIIKEYAYDRSDDLVQTINYFSEASVVVRNIVFMNLLYLTFSGEDYNVKEHFMLEDIQQQFKISTYKKKQMLSLIFSYRDLQEKLFEVTHAKKRSKLSK